MQFTRSDLECVLTERHLRPGWRGCPKRRPGAVCSPRPAPFPFLSTYRDTETRSERLMTTGEEIVRAHPKLRLATDARRAIGGAEHTKSEHS